MNLKKKITMRVACVLLSAIVFCGTVLSSVQTAKATAIPEMLYYTYWELISSLSSACGYSTDVDVPAVNNHGVTGEDVWDNFCTFVESAAKANYAFLSDGAKMALTELRDLANTVTDKGISISQDLYDLLRDAFAYEATAEGVTNYSNQFDCSSAEKVKDMLIRLSGCSSYEGVNNLSSLASAVAGGAILNGIYMASCQRFIFWTGTETLTYEPYHFLLNGESFSAQSYWVNQFDKSVTISYGSFGVNPDYSWIMQHGAICYPDTLTLERVSGYACPKEVPDVIPWERSDAIPKEWHVVRADEKIDTGSEPDKDNDKDKKKKKHTLPILIPIPGITLNPDPEVKPDPEPDPDPDPEGDQDSDSNKEKDVDTIIDDVKGLGDITKLFPFCIPFDFVKMVKGMTAKKKAPKFTFSYKFEPIDYTFKLVVDLTKYDEYIKLFRYGMQVMYVLALMFITVKLSNIFT